MVGDGGEFDRVVLFDGLVKEKRLERVAGRTVLEKGRCR